MNSATHNNSATAAAATACEPLSHHDPQVQQRVLEWFASGRPMVWIPILSQANFLGTPLRILQALDPYQATIRWPILQPEDLLQLPDGITGWLMLADAEDTDVACGVWRAEVYILSVRDKRNGRKQTLLGECVDDATGQADDSAQSAV